MSNKRDLKRLCVNLPSHVVDKIDEWASQHQITRTTAIMLLCVQSLTDEELEKRSEKNPL